jgi:putative GTP pyrophosphokinase
MKKQKEIVTDLEQLENLIDYNKKIKESDETFQKIMSIYAMALKEMSTKVEIYKDEFKMFYNYDLIDHINFRIKSSESIMKKMQDKGVKLTYKEMIENINDIAGLRVICPVQKDIYSIKNLIQNIPGIQTLKEKDYVAHPKKCGYKSYHIILAVPVVLSKKLIYVKVEVQIRTMAMDVWATIEHKMRYKPEQELTEKQSKEWSNCAKAINKVDKKLEYLT